MEAACAENLIQEESHIESPHAAVSSAEQSTARCECSTAEQSSLCEPREASVNSGYCSTTSLDDHPGFRRSQSNSECVVTPQRMVGVHFRSSAAFACLMIVLQLASAASGAGIRINSGAMDGSYTQLTWEAYQTSDNDTVFPRLATFFPPGTFFGDSTFSLGDTSYR